MPDPTPSDNTTSLPANGADATVVPSQTGPAGLLNRVSGLPDRIGRFRVKSLLGEGAFARVYLGVDPELDREVAIKVPKVDELTPEFRESFLRENRLAAIIQHPNICPVYEVGTDGGFPYIVMRVVPSTLGALLKRLPEPMPPKNAVAVARKLALGLVAAHAQKVVHRDLKPANVLYDEANREVLIADFGLARFADKATEASNGVSKGTPVYMSPEQARGRSDLVGTSSDIYSLGVMLYEMVTGRVPFTGAVWEVMRDHCETTPPLPSQLRLGIDPELDAIVLKAMAKQPADRYASAKAFAQALADYLMVIERGGSVAQIVLPNAADAKPNSPSEPVFEVGAKESTKNLAKESNKNAPSVQVAQSGDVWATWSRPMEPNTTPAKESEKGAPAQPKLLPKPVAVVIVDEEDEEDDAPTEKAKKPKKPKGKRAKDKKKGGLPVSAWVGIGTACAAVVVLVVVLVTGKKKPDPTPPQVNAPVTPVPPPPNSADSKRKQAVADFKSGEDYYVGSNGKPKDFVKAREWFEKAAAQGHAEAQKELGEMYEHGRAGPVNYEKAREWYEKAAAQGNMYAQSSLGRIYGQGHGVPTDSAKAREWYEKAAAQGHAEAQKELGEMYEHGRGVQIDPEKARVWYEKAARLGNAAAQFRFGFMCAHGLGGAKSEVAAREWYEKAALLGHSLAQNNLGAFLNNGQGGPTDYVKAREWYEKAANQGNAVAQNNLGKLYEYGRGGPIDYVKARAWYKKAADQKIEEAIQALVRLGKK